MLYTIYKITNINTGQIYIGKHQTKNINDSYMGSGKRIINAISKYGLENFEKKIIHVFDNEEDMNAKEAELVSESFCLREDTYNIVAGGSGGFGYINRNKNKYVLKTKATMSLKSQEEVCNINKKKANFGDKNGMFGSARFGNDNPRFGAIVTQETRDKISKANQGNCPSEETRLKLSKSQTERWKSKELRENQSQLAKSRNAVPPSAKGTRWYNNGQISKRLKVCPEGWIGGRIKWK